MAEFSTIARPYAKAAFESSLESKALAEWSSVLELLALIANDEQVIAILTNPNINADQRLSVFESIAGDKLTDKLGNFLKLLSENDRLAALPAIYERFLALKAEHEKTIDVDLASAVALSEDQKALFATKLEAKLGRKVSIQNTVDSTLLGGVIIKAEDLVIDGSVRGKIAKLAESLTN